MCGIAGFFGRRPVPDATVERMLVALRQRGPDAEHVQRWSSRYETTSEAAPNALLHTRLAIIDPRPEADSRWPTPPATSSSRTTASLRLVRTPRR
jgi:asparagine synthase (glutamine-hydrolysing)